MPSLKIRNRSAGRPASIHATASIIARVPPALVKAVDRAAKAEGVSRAAMVRQFIKAGLAARSVKPRKS
jgi:hypothetical protein